VGDEDRTRFGGSAIIYGSKEFAMNRWSGAATKGALAGAQAAFPVAALVNAARKALDGKLEEAQRKARRALLQAGFGTAFGAGFGLLREAKLLPESVVVGFAFGTATWTLGRLTGTSFPLEGRPFASLPAHWAYGISVERRTRR